MFFRSVNDPSKSKSKGRQCEDVNGSVSQAGPLDAELLEIVLVWRPVDSTKRAEIGGNGEY